MKSALSNRQNQSPISQTPNTKDDYQQQLNLIETQIDSIYKDIANLKGNLNSGASNKQGADDEEI